jgi:hypothetical protein
MRRWKEKIRVFASNGRGPQEAGGENKFLDILKIFVKVFA